MKKELDKAYKSLKLRVEALSELQEESFSEGREKEIKELLAGMLKIHSQKTALIVKDLNDLGNKLDKITK